MELTLQRLGAWAGIVMLVLFGVFFFLIAGLIPPLSPSWSAAHIAHFLATHETRVRLGIALMLLAAPISFPFIVVISQQLRRIEGRWGMLSLTQLAAGVVFPIGFLFPMMVLAAAAYRPEHRPVEITLALDDVFWLMFIGIVGTLVLQCVCIAVATFADRSEQPVFPRWVGYFNAWCAVLFVPGGAVMLFHSGPLAWNGVFAFWIPVVVFTAWMVTMPVVMLRSIGALQLDAAQPMAGS